MIQRFAIKASNGRSDIVVGDRWTNLPKALKTMAARGAKAAVIADAAVTGRYGKPLVQALRRSGFNPFLLTVPSGERSKNLKEAGRLYGELARARIERRSWIIALGGGVTGDLAGLVAATYLRGVPFVQVPTTLLAQVDSSIGGKTGIDIPEGKNLVGAFHHPALIWIDPAVLQTLSKEHWITGLAEIIKYGAIWDEKLFSTLERRIDFLLRGPSPEWTPIIARCAQIKAIVVTRDPKETKGLRALLNFGHSVGHAIEGATRFGAYTHGEAISIGMFVAGRLSQQAGLIREMDRMRLCGLLTKAGLPAAVHKTIPRPALFNFLARDKKVEQGTVKFVLLKGIGRAVSGQTVDPMDLHVALAESGL